LTELGIEYKTDKATDHHFTDVYEQYFSELRDKKLNIFEIGVLEGASVRMLRDYFFSSDIYAIDYEDKKHLSGERIFIEKGNQTDIKFMTNVFLGKQFDIIIDDGGHSMEQQQISIEAMFSRLKSKGIYIIEDLHTSYRYGYSKSHNNTTLRLIENISNNTPCTDKFYIKNINKITSLINSCKVYYNNNRTSITSIIIKK